MQEFFTQELWHEKKIIIITTVTAKIMTTGNQQVRREC